MENFEQLQNRIKNGELLTDKELQLFAELFIARYKFVKANAVLGENVKIMYDLDKIISAYMPRLTMHYIGRRMTYEELITTLPVIERIVKGEVIEFANASNLLAESINIVDSVNEPEILYAQLKRISTKQGINALVDSRIINKDKALNNARRNYHLLMRNQKQLDNHDYYRIENDGHKDIDVCDNFIGRVFKLDDLVRPPYHVNCKCEIIGITEKEYKDGDN